MKTKVNITDTTMIIAQIEIVLLAFVTIFISVPLPPAQLRTVAIIGWDSIFQTEYSSRPFPSHPP